jgi:hypothetical protein
MSNAMNDFIRRTAAARKQVPEYDPGDIASRRQDLSRRHRCYPA